MIGRFTAEHRFLSNFYYSPLIYEGVDYKTAEHAYQAAKTADMAAKRRIRKALTPGAAKRLGQCVPRRPDWEDIKLRVMEEILTIKFKDPDLREKLRATGSEPLAEGNDWGDRYWGIDLKTGRGENHLGKILQRVRAKL